MNCLKKNNPITARKLRSLFRFIDDLNVISDGGGLEHNFTDPENL